MIGLTPVVLLPIQVGLHMGKTLKGIHHKDQSADLPRDAALYLDFYGGLLTDKQAEILNCYYNDDFSISEIAAGLGISRQAAHDAIRIGTLALAEYEDKLGLVNSYMRERSRLNDACNNVFELLAAIDQLRGDAAGALGDDCAKRFEHIHAIALRLQQNIIKEI